MKGQATIRRDYNLSTKIEALNLLDQCDSDFRLVKDRLGIPVKTLRGWRVDQEKLRRQYDDRQFRYFADIKFELLQDMLETARDIMKKIKVGGHEGVAVSQLAYTLSTLLTHSKQLEDEFEDLATDTESAADAPNRIEYVYDGKVHDAPPWAERNPEKSRSVQSVGVRAALGQIGVGKERHIEGGAPGAQTLLVGGADLPDGEPGVARLDKERQRSRRRKDKRERTPDRSAKRRHDSDTQRSQAG